MNSAISVQAEIALEIVFLPVQIAEFLGMSEGEKRYSNTELSHMLAQFGTLCTVLVAPTWPRRDEASLRHHPTLVWGIDGPGRFPALTNIAKALFCVYGTSAGTERSFKARTLVHTKTRNRLSDLKADKQSYLVYNQKQRARANVALSAGCINPESV